VAPFAATLNTGEHPVRPFHWAVEFPEVFALQNGGFDAIVGNPPFAGRNTIIAGHRKNYLAWLQALHEGAHGNADLVAHFFRRAFLFLRKGGVFGLFATNTIGQGDTRASGLTKIIAGGGSILRATRRIKWPGEAAVVVSVVHVVRGQANAPTLDGHQVARISAYLVEGDLDTNPKHLAQNAHLAFKGSELQGMGFTFDDKLSMTGSSLSLAEMETLVRSSPHCAARIFPYLGGEEVNNDPAQQHHRYVIDLNDLSLEAAQEEYPELLAIIRNFVKPERDRLKGNVDADRRRASWWRWSRQTPDLYARIRSLDTVVATIFTSPHLCFSMLTAHQVFANSVVVVALSNFAPFAVLQCRIHEIWARFFSSSMKDDLRYAPSDCFRTFAFPKGFETDATLEAAGEAYHTFRAKLMIDRSEGLTKTYNRFHTRGENAPDIARLRALHADMDAAVLRAYGWGDLAYRAAPEFIEQEADEGKKPKTRLDWLAEFRDEVLARLLALNADRAATERATGLTAAPDDDVDEMDDEGEAA
jgi:hypothetical protein